MIADTLNLGFHKRAQSTAVIWLLILLAVIIRMMVPLVAFTRSMDRGVFYTPDTWTYLLPAQSLVSFGTFSSHSFPELFRTPGYPLFLVPGILSGNLELVTITLQIILSGFIVYLVYSTALLIFERSDVALFSAALYTFEPLAILYSSQLMTETLFTTLIMLSLFFLSRLEINQGALNVVLASLALAGAIYVRPIAFYLPAIVTLVILIRAAIEKKGRYKSFLWSMVFFAFSMGLTLCWQHRNYNQAGYFGLSAVKEANLYFCQGGAIWAHERGVTLAQQQTEMGYVNWNRYFDQHPEQRNWSQSKVFEFMGAEAVNVIASNPFTFSKLALVGVLRTALGPGLSSYLVIFKLQPDHTGWALGVADTLQPLDIPSHLMTAPPLILWGNVALAVPLAIYWCLAIFALLSGRCKSQQLSLVLPILICTVVYFLVAPLVAGHSRFRHPVMPILCILGGCGIWALIHPRGIRSAGN